MWLKMSEIAKELGVSKEVVKYHKRSLPEMVYKKVNDEILISPEGIATIKSKLKKETYNAHFETYVRKGLRSIEGELDTVIHLLLEQSHKVDQRLLEGLKMDLNRELKNLVATETFQRWYCDKENLNSWESALIEDIKVMDIILFNDLLRRIETL